MTRRLSLLRVAVPGPLADQVGSLLLLSGAGGVVHEERPGETDLVVYGEDLRSLRLVKERADAALRSAGMVFRMVVSRAPVSADAWRNGPRFRSVTILPDLRLVPARSSGTPPKAAARGSAQGGASSSPHERPDRLFLHPALAFGFGDHPTTRLAAREIARLCAESVPRSVLDIGTGTGVLALLAARRGVSDVVGLDVDPVAIRVARRNARSNRLSARCHFEMGDASSVRRRFELVVANLELRTLLPLVPVATRLVRAGGTLVVTGFLSAHRQDVEQALEKHGFVTRAARSEGEFHLIVGARAGQSATRRGTARKTRSR